MRMPYQEGNKKYGYVCRTLKRATTPVEELTNRTPQSEAIRLIIANDGKPLNENLMLKRIRQTPEGLGSFRTISDLLGELGLLYLVRFTKGGYLLSLQAKNLMDKIQKGEVEVHNFQA